MIVDLSRKKKLDADPKAIQQIEFVGQLKNEVCINADGTQSIFTLMIFLKKQRNKLKIFSSRCNDQQARVKLTNAQVNK